MAKRRSAFLVACIAALSMAFPTAAQASSPHPLYPFSLNYTNPCTGETVYLTGFIQEIHSFYKNHTTDQISIHVSGTTSEGVRYVAFEVKHVNYLPENGDHVVMVFHLNRLGDSMPNDDEIAYVNYQVSRGPNGELILRKESEVFSRCV
jgi:hypothetical protein